VWLNTHFNHPREITADAARAVERLLRAGIPVNNQSVLLRGVNDSVDVMRELVQGLLRIKVRPYYLYHCDDVVGAAHLRTSVRRGLEILEGLRGHTTGFAIPTFVVDAPGGGGKIPLMPNYLVSQGENSLVVRNFEGVLVRIDDGPVLAPSEAKPERGAGRPRGGRAGRASQPPQSVADLLAGEGRRLVPQGIQHYARRRAVAGSKRARSRRAQKPVS
jgi:lysine 2,3-aminomutase